MERHLHDLLRQGVLASVLVLAATGCGAGRAPSVDVLPPPDTPDTGGPYEVTAVVRSEAPIASATVRWFVAATDAPRPLRLAREAGTDRWSVGIPGQPEGAVVHFTVEVEDDEGHLVIRPAAPKLNEPAPTYQFKVLGVSGG